MTNFETLKARYQMNTIHKIVFEKRLESLTDEAEKKAFRKVYNRFCDKYGKITKDFALAVTASILKKVSDPQGKTAQKSEKVSNSGVNPMFSAMKMGMYSDFAKQDSKEYLVSIHGKEKESLIPGDTLTDGTALLNETVKALCELTEKLSERYPCDIPFNFLDEKVTETRVKRRILTIMDTERVDTESKEYSNIQIVYRKVRKYIESERSQKVKENGFSYVELDESNLESLDIDTLDKIYYRSKRFADIGGQEYDFNGKDTFYTANIEDMRTIPDIMHKLNLTDRQRTILDLRLQGYGDKIIAKKLNISVDSVKTHRKRLQNVLLKAIQTDKDFSVLDEKPEKVTEKPEKVTEKPKKPYSDNDFYNMFRNW